MFTVHVSCELLSKDVNTLLVFSARCRVSWSSPVVLFYVLALFALNANITKYMCFTVTLFFSQGLCYGTAMCRHKRWNETEVY